MSADSLYSAIPAARRFSPDDVVQDVESLTHHDLNVCRQAVTGEKVKTASRFKHSPELCEAHIKPAKIILIPFPLVVPAVGFHFEVRGIRDYQVNGVIRESGDVLQAVSVDKLNTVYIYSIFHRSVSVTLIGSLCFCAKAVGLG